jgi:hypothetical protein
MEWKYFNSKIVDVKDISSDDDENCYYELVPTFVEENGYLPVECRECYKALIFWPYSRANITKFKKMLRSLPVSIHGKYNESVVVFYFKDRIKMLNFLNTLEQYMKQFEVEGRIQWRVSGNYWQKAYPHFFKSAKEMNPVTHNQQITIKKWMEQKGILYE